MNYQGNEVPIFSLPGEYDFDEAIKEDKLHYRCDRESEKQVNEWLYDCALAIQNDKLIQEEMKEWREIENSWDHEDWEW